MVAISNRFGSGGANLVPQGGAGQPSLVDVLRDVADDLAALKPATVTSADAAATFGANEQKLLNELKKIVNAMAAVVVKTTKI